MYKKILAALDHTPADQSLLPHVKELARLTGAELVLLHVATGWLTQWGHLLDVDTDKSEEIRADQAYLEKTAEDLKRDGFSVRALLIKGYPHREILKIAQSEGCDLIAMTTHGHRFIYDLLIGSTIDKVRHESEIPLLVVRAMPAPE